MVQADQENGLCRRRFDFYARRKCMENSSKFFCNKDCQYYPCHPGLEDFNCLFCYCPLNFTEHCPGNPEYIRTKDGRVIKNCMGCDFPHRPENYDIIVEFMKKKMPVFRDDLVKPDPK